MIPPCNPEWFEFMSRVFNDTLSSPVKLAFLHGQTRDNESSVLDAGLDLLNNETTERLGITWADSSIYDEWIAHYEAQDPELAERIRTNLQPSEEGSIAGYPGHVHWTKELKLRGIDERDIIKIEPGYNFYFNTDGEAEGLVKYCIENDIQRVGVVGAPFHQPRVFLSGISALVRANATDIQLYSVPGNALDWNEEVTHSQGTINGKRKHLLLGEYSRIIKYHKSGTPPLVSLINALDYLDKRD